MNNQIFLKKYANSLERKIINSKNTSFFKKPFEHLIIDKAFDKKFANKISRSFPKLTRKNWEFSNTDNIEVKYRTKWLSEFDIPNNIIDVVRIFNSSIILKAVSKKIGIKKIMPDPYFTGGGLNLTEKGGLLDVHIDGNYHDASGLNRRLNLLYYLTPNWKKEFGGELCLYDKTGKKLVKKIQPIFNRIVIFNTHDFSYHGLPDKVNFPKHNPRKSVILYYYTKEARPKSQSKYKKPHSALWVKKNMLDKKGKISRKFY